MEKFGPCNAAKRGWHWSEGIGLNRNWIRMLRFIQSNLGRDLDTLCGGAPSRPGLDLGAQIGAEKVYWGVNFAVEFWPQIAASKWDRKMGLLMNFYMGTKMRSHFDPGKWVHFWAAFLFPGPRKSNSRFRFLGQNLGSKNDQHAHGGAAVVELRWWRRQPYRGRLWGVSGPARRDFDVSLQSQLIFECKPRAKSNIHKNGRLIEENRGFASFLASARTKRYALEAPELKPFYDLVLKTYIKRIFADSCNKLQKESSFSLQGIPKLYCALLRLDSSKIRSPMATKMMPTNNFIAQTFQTTNNNSKHNLC